VGGSGCEEKRLTDFKLSEVADATPGIQLKIAKERLKRLKKSEGK